MTFDVSFYSGFRESFPGTGTGLYRAGRSTDHYTGTPSRQRGRACKYFRLYSGRDHPAAQHVGSTKRRGGGTHRTPFQRTGVRGFCQSGGDAGIHSYLLPDNQETIKATEMLAKEGFVVMPYMYPDLNAARDLVDAGAACVMPLGAPIGSNKGLCYERIHPDPYR